MNRPSVLLVAALLLSPSLATAKGPARLDPAEAGKITAEIEAKEKTIRGEYGDRANKDLSREERKEMEAKLQAARSEVLEDHGTSNKDYDLGMGRLGKDGSRSMQEAKAEHAKKLEAEKAAGDKGAAEQGNAGQIQVQRGFNEENPVTVTEQPSEGGVQVQRGGGEEGIEIPVTGGGEPGAPAAGGGESW